MLATPLETTMLPEEVSAAADTTFNAPLELCVLPPELIVTDPPVLPSE